MTTRQKHQQQQNHNQQIYKNSQHHRRRRRRRRHLCPSNASLILLLVFFLSSSTMKIMVSSSSSPSSDGLYHSVRELDKYGNSVQLRNAAECSNRYGSLVIAAVACPDKEGNGGGETEEEEEGGIVVCTLRPFRPGVKKPKKEEGCVHIIATSDMVPSTITTTTTTTAKNTDNTILLALISTGLQPDATLLLRLLRSYARRWWDRYDIIPSINVMTDATRAVKLGFMGYDASKEISSFGIGNVIENENEEEEESSGGMSRPFGVTSLLLGVQQSQQQQQQQQFQIKSVNPNGVQKSWVARAIGKQSSDANSLLQHRWQKSMTVQEVKEMCCGIMREVLLGDVQHFEKDGDNGSVSSSQQRMEKADVVCEVLTSRGEKIVERFPLYDAGGGRKDGGIVSTI